MRPLCIRGHSAAYHECTNAAATKEPEPTIAPTEEEAAGTWEIIL
jgi:photosystem II stability/assembly factor-like uncharacterized protein